ncbi:hypothetical protein FQR65_LT20843 [Abscondita terminalis]|nr:hypothetical protein FQR65_LT20843 [Abscondita terminalis]
MVAGRPDRMSWMAPRGQQEQLMTQPVKSDCRRFAMPRVSRGGSNPPACQSPRANIKGVARDMTAPTGLVATVDGNGNVTRYVWTPRPDRGCRSVPRRGDGEHRYDAAAASAHDRLCHGGGTRPSWPRWPARRRVRALLAPQPFRPGGVTVLRPDARPGDDGGRPWFGVDLQVLDANGNAIQVIQYAAPAWRGVPRTGAFHPGDPGSSAQDRARPRRRRGQSGRAGGRCRMMVWCAITPMTPLDNRWESYQYARPMPERGPAGAAPAQLTLAAAGRALPAVDSPGFAAAAARVLRAQACRSTKIDAAGFVDAN